MFFPKYNKADNYFKPVGVNSAVYLHNQDLISKFRFFENGGAAADAKAEVQHYLDVYTSGPLTKADMLTRINEGRSVDPDFAKQFKVKRAGKDKDDMFWSFGKIHGLENIAFLDEKELLACNGNPFLIQRLVDKVNDSEKPLPPQTFDEMIQTLHANLESYK